MWNYDYCMVTLITKYITRLLVHFRLKQLVKVPTQLI